MELINYINHSCNNELHHCFTYLYINCILKIKKDGDDGLEKVTLKNMSGLEGYSWAAKDSDEGYEVQYK